MNSAKVAGNWFFVVMMAPVIVPAALYLALTRR